MNERIKQLVRESNLDVYGLGKERYRWEYTVAKFAELLVQECMSELYLHGYDDARTQIKQHFGVEE